MTWEWFTFNKTHWTDNSVGWLIGSLRSRSLIIPTSVGTGYNVSASSVHSSSNIDSAEVAHLTSNVPNTIWQMENFGMNSYLFPATPTAIVLRSSNGGYLSKTFESYRITHTSPTTMTKTSTMPAMTNAEYKGSFPITIGGYRNELSSVILQPATDITSPYGQAYRLVDSSTSGATSQYLFARLDFPAFFAPAVQTRHPCKAYPLSCAWLFFQQVDGSFAMTTVDSANTQSMKFLALRQDNFLGLTRGTTRRTNLWTVQNYQTYNWNNKRTVEEI